MLDLRAAFDSDDVPRKNIALRRARDRIAELEAALRTAQTAIAKCLKEGGRLDGGPDTDWWPGIVTAQQTIAAALRST